MSRCSVDHVFGRVSGRRRLTSVLLGMALGFVAAAPVHSQVTLPDSGAIYERLAQEAENGASSDAAAGRQMFPHAKAALAWYTRRGDERGQARALVQVSNAFFYQGQRDSS
ncbi:MAG: hypothetical protein ABIW79_09780, partial [Gemmatimonas sp.]